MRKLVVLGLVVACAAPPEPEAPDDTDAGAQAVDAELFSARETSREVSISGTRVEIDVESVAAALAEDAVAVSYLRHAKHDGRSGARDALLAFLVRPSGGVERIELGLAAEIEELVDSWREALGEPLEGASDADGTESGTDEGATELGSALRVRVLDPICARAGEARTLHVVLDDVLHLVPLDALPLAEGLVGERFAIRVVPSFGSLVRGPRKSTLAPSLLVVGDVDYGAAQPGAVRSFDPLPGAAEEAAFVAGLFLETHGVEPVFLRGAAADHRALFEHVPRARWLHVATHGWYAPNWLRPWSDPRPIDERKGLGLSLEEQVKGLSPTLLSGLALAGANLPEDELGRVPGLVTGEDFAKLDLASSELAVLAASETSVGVLRAGQGPASLQTALHRAGARTVIGSLWKVDDDATRALFERFYTKLWREGLGPAEALWQAKLALRAAGYPLRDWAAWILTGAPG